MSDVTSTKGHIGEVTSCEFVKESKTEFMTSSRDGSIRLWNIESKLVGVD